MKKSFLDRLTGWWRGASPRSKRRRLSREECATGGHDRRDCEADPESALAELQEEQALIAQELEDTFLAYDKKLQAAARRLSGLDSEPVTEKELAKLRAEQLELWRLVRRSQAASRTTRELKRELKEWSSRESGVAPFGHPDHPGTRAELVASELRVRGVGAGARPERAERAEGSPRPDQGIVGSPAEPAPNLPSDAGGDVFGILHGSAEPAPTCLAGRQGEAEGLTTGLGGRPQMPNAKCLSDAPEPGPAWEHDDDEALLRELRSRRGEMERILKSGADEGSVRELAAFLCELRELHAHLRLHDRRNGISRERWRMGMPGQVNR